MNDIEREIQKYLVNFVKALPSFIVKWKSFSEDVLKPVRGLVNQAEQMRHVESANLKEMDDFEEVQQRVLFKIYEGVEVEIKIIKELVDRMNKMNNEMRNRLTLFENATLKLEDWNDNNSQLLKGTATQPSLQLLLDYSLDFWIFFSTISKNINNSLKSMNCRDVNSMSELENAFKVDTDNKSVSYLIAITQYIDNAKAIN